MAVLNVLKGPNVGHRYPLEHDRTILGRHPDCQIVLEIGAISREHAAIERVNGDFFIEDLGSRNGTFVNGQPVDLAQPRKLLENDRVKICDMLLTFHRDARKIDSAALTTRPPIEMVSDDAGGSTILSTLEVRGKSSSTAPGVRPEVKLQALLEITRNLGATLGLDQVLPKILDSLFKIFVQADRGFIVLREPDGGALAPKAFRQRREDDDENVRISRTIVNKAMNDKEAILSHDAATDKRFDTSQSIADFRIRSMMCAPLVSSEGQALGVIQIDTMDQRTQFTQDDLDVLAAVACQAAVSVENAQLHGAALKRQALERDLTLAHTVQRGFLPSQPPKIAGYEFFDFYEPANQVGGDYFDYIPLPGNRLGVIAADVAGKGIAAALLMAKLSAEHREILDLVYYQEQSVSEAAEILAIPEATVKTRMFYARKKLGEILKERGLDRGWP